MAIGLVFSIFDHSGCRVLMDCITVWLSNVCAVFAILRSFTTKIIFIKVVMIVVVVVFVNVVFSYCCCCNCYC